MATVNIPIPKAVAAYPLYDARLLPVKPAFAVTLGGSAVAAQTSSPTSNTSSQLNFLTNISSLDTIIDRRVTITTTFLVAFTAVFNQYVGSSLPAGGLGLYDNIVTGGTNPLSGAQQYQLIPGRHFGIAAYPFHQLVTSMTVGVNNSNTIFNAQACLPFALRLQDSKRGRVAAPTAGKLDTLVNYPDVALGTVNAASPYGGYETSEYAADPSNGAYSVQFVVPTGSSTGTGSIPSAATAGTVIAAGSAIGTYTNNSIVHTFLNGLPVVTIGGSTNTYYYAIAITTTEEIQVSPWTQGVFAAEYEAGLTGVSNTTLQVQLQSPASACGAQGLLATLTPEVTITTTGFGPGAYDGGSTLTFSNTFLSFNTLNPPLSLEVPTTCVVPYHTMTPYTTQPGISCPAWGGKLTSPSVTNVSTNTQVLSQIPDFVAIAAIATPTGSERPYYLPISNVSITFNGQNGLLTAVSKQQLWNMSRTNGLNVPWLQWRGHASQTWSGVPQSGSAASLLAVINTAQNASSASIATTIAQYTAFVPNYLAYPYATPIIRTSGSFVLLRMGTDITLPPNLAAGVQGSFSFQANLQVENWSTAAANTPTLVIVEIKSGYLTTDKGAASTNTAPLNTNDVIAAQTGSASGGDARSHSQVSRAWGGSAMANCNNAAGMTAAGLGWEALSGAGGGDAGQPQAGQQPGQQQQYTGGGAISGVGSATPYGADNNAYAKSGGARGKRGWGAEAQGVGMGSVGQGSYGQGSIGQGDWAGSRPRRGRGGPPPPQQYYAGGGYDDGAGGGGYDDGGGEYEEYDDPTLSGGGDPMAYYTTR